MPKVNQRASTPETPRLKRDTLRRAALYNSNPVGPYLKPKLTVPVDEDSLVRVSNRGIPFAAEKPSAQQMEERNRGFIKSAPLPSRKNSSALGPGWNVGYLNKASVYPTEPHNLLRFGHAGALKMQRGRMNKNIVNTEWTPKLVMEPSKAAGNVNGAPGAWPEAAAHPTGAIVAGRERKNESWFAHETSAAPPTLPRPTPGISVTLPTAEALEERTRAQGITRGNELRSLERLSRTLEREADAERRFAVQLNAARQPMGAAAKVRSEESAVLTEGLGPEATLKVLRHRMHAASVGSHRKKGGGRSSAKGGASSSSSSSKHGGRVVMPKSERRRPRFCGGLSVLVRDQHSLDAGEAMRQAQSSEKQKTQQKWALIGRFHARWFQTARDKQRFTYDALAVSLADAAKENADVTCVTRDQFASVTLVRLRDMGLGHRLYSALDDDRGSESLPWVSIMLPLAMLAEAQREQPQAAVLLAGLRLLEALAPPLTMSSVLSVLGCCCANRMERLEVQARAASGFEFALRAGAAAAEMAATVSGSSGGGGWSEEALQQQHDKGVLDAVGAKGSSGLTPELVVQVLTEYPDLAADIQRQMHDCFASAGRAIPSLAVVDSTPSNSAGGGSAGKKEGKKSTAHGGLAALTGGSMMDRTGGGFSSVRANGRSGRGWIEEGVAAGEKRQSAFLFPSTHEESDDDEDDVLMDG